MLVLGIGNSGTLSGTAGPRGLPCHWDLLSFLWIGFHLRQVFSSGGTFSYGFMGRELLFVSSFSEICKNRRKILPLTPMPIPKRDAIERRKENESHLGKRVCLLQTCYEDQEMVIPDHLTCLLRNLYAGQQAIVRTGRQTVPNQERSTLRLYIASLFI